MSRRRWPWRWWPSSSLAASPASTIHILDEGRYAASPAWSCRSWPSRARRRSTGNGCACARPSTVPRCSSAMPGSTARFPRSRISALHTRRRLPPSRTSAELRRVLRPPGGEERGRGTGGVVGGELAVVEELHRETRQVQRIAATVRHRAEPDEGNVFGGGHLRDRCRLLVIGDVLVAGRRRRGEVAGEERGIDERDHACPERG